MVSRAGIGTAQQHAASGDHPDPAGPDSGRDAAEDGGSARATRRRGETLESAIYAVVLDQLSRVGYARLTMEGVALAARTGKASLYRRWSHKDDLIVDALDAAMPHVGEPPDTGSIRGDLVALLGATASFVGSPVGQALQQSIMAAEREAYHDEAGRAACDAIHGIKRRVIARRQELLYAVLRRGVERGTVRPGAVNRWVVDVGPALLLTYCLGQGPPVPESEVEAVVDKVLVPLVSPGDTGSRG